MSGLNGGRDDLRIFMQTRAQGFRQIRHIVKVINIALIYPLHDLPRTERFLGPFVKKLLEIALRQSEQVYFLAAAVTKQSD